MREIIEREMEEFGGRKSRYKRDKWMYFINFHMRLPRKDLGGLSMSEKMARDYGYLDIKFIGRFPDAERHSELYENQTPKEFYETIKKALREKGISVDDVAKLNSESTKGEFVDESKIIELFKFVFPAYIRLREMGYNHYPDLTV